MLEFYAYLSFLPTIFRFVSLMRKYSRIVLRLGNVEIVVVGDDGLAEDLNRM
jgi:hypothetical protein